MRERALQRPQLALSLLRMAAARVRELQERLEELAAERVERRIARAVLRLVHQGGAGHRRACSSTPLSRKEQEGPGP